MLLNICVFHLAEGNETRSKVEGGLDYCSLLVELTVQCIKCDCGDRNTRVFATSFTPKMVESSDSIYSSTFMLQSLWFNHSTWNEFPRNCQFFSNLVRVFLDPKLQQNSQFFLIWFTSGKMMTSYIFKPVNEGVYWIRAFWYFLSKIGQQKYTA